MQKNVAISVNKFSRGGGMESYMLDLVRGFTEQGHAIEMYAGSFDETLPEYPLIHPHTIHVKRIPKKLRPLLFSHIYHRQQHTNEALITHNYVDRADVLICGGNHLGYLKAMQQMPTWLDKLTIRRERCAYQSAKTIVAHSALMKRELVELFGIDEHKIKVIYPPANTARFYPDDAGIAATRAQYGFKDDETVFVFPSTGHKRKGLDFLADFFEHTDLPVKLAVAGSPLPRPMKNVIELGFCQDMPALYRAADFTIMASIYEPFGLVGVESVLCGTRVVFADNMACTEIMDERAGLYFSRHHQASLAAAIEQAVALKHQEAHKIAKPFDALQYDPRLQPHIMALQKLL